MSMSVSRTSSFSSPFMIVSIMVAMICLLPRCATSDGPQSGVDQDSASQQNIAGNQFSNGDDHGVSPQNGNTAKSANSEFGPEFSAANASNSQNINSAAADDSLAPPAAFNVIGGGAGAAGDGANLNANAVAKQSPAVDRNMLAKVGGNPHGTLSWVGYNYKNENHQLEVQIVTEGSPTYHIFQEVNRRGQSEMVVRFLNTSLRKKVRRDIDATEFRSPVAYIRMRTNLNFKHTDVVMTMRDAVQPRVVAKGSNIMFLFNIPDHWYAPKSEERPVASAEIVQDEVQGVSGTVDTHEVSVSAKKKAGAYVANPGADAFREVNREAGVLLVPKADSSKELVPVNQQAPKAPASDGDQLLENRESEFHEFIYRVNGVAQSDFTGDTVSADASGLLEDAPVGEGAPKPVMATDGGPSAGDVVPVSMEAQAAISTKKAIRLDFRDAPISQIVRLIANESGLNFIIAPKAGNIKTSISLKNVPWDVALKAVLESNHLGMQEIAPGLVRVDDLQTFITDHETEAAARQAAAGLTPVKVLVMALSYAKADAAATMVNAMLPKATDPKNVAEARNYARFKVQADTRSNSVIVEATPNVLSTIKVLLERLDIPTPQVRIATRLVEINSNLQDGLGLTWGSPLSANPGRGLGFGSLPFSKHMSSQFSVDPGGASENGGSAALKFGSIDNLIALDLQLRAYEIQKKAETLQTQDIVVQDLEKASVSAGTSDYVQTLGSINSPGTIAEIAYNLSLDVTPHITADGVVQMVLDIKGDTPLPSTSASSSIASKNSRRLTTTLLKRSGETAVIGGLYSSDISKTKRGIPFFSSIPLFGALFRSTESKDTKKDLLIMVTPTILGSSLSSGGGSGGSSMSTPGFDESAQPSSAKSAENVPSNVAPQGQQRATNGESQNGAAVNGSDQGENSDIGQSSNVSGQSNITE
jgi:type IV pilus secretin PilQ/predicted competence protein